MNRWLLTADADEVVLGHRGDLARVEVPESFFQCRRASEGPFHGNLLVKQHAQQQCIGVSVEQIVGGCVAGDVERSGHRRQMMNGSMASGSMS